MLPKTLETAHINIQSLTQLEAASPQCRDELNPSAVERDASVVEAAQNLSLYQEPLGRHHSVEGLTHLGNHVNLRHLSLLNCHDKAFGDSLIHLGDRLESVAIGFPNDMERFKAIQKKAKLPITEWDLANLDNLRSVTFYIPQLWYSLPYVLRIIGSTLQTLDPSTRSRLVKITFMVGPEPLKRVNCWHELDMLLVSACRAQIIVDIPSMGSMWNSYLVAKAERILPGVHNAGRLKVRVIRRHVDHPHRNLG
ncbi:hypothetical protein VNI00_017371 [Paramarasmius palmivorus]|uniref:Uncharacterized protein n=1 Tax=Paramarasmius palmivorus TaxID=297713 RepID=A0AAW0B5G7_9AGAR